MISAEYCQLMARYNTWQNQSLVSAASALSDQQRWLDRGAFFGSIAATLNHLYWDDGLWLRRFAGDERPEEDTPATLGAPSDWAVFVDLRRKRDAEVEAWAARQSDADMGGVVAWFPGGGTERVEKTRAICLMHFFNHQTHHRGQIHSMLTAAGANPEATDLAMLG